MLTTISAAKATIGTVSAASPKNTWTAPILGGLLTFFTIWFWLVFHGSKIIYHDINERMRYHYETKKTT